MNQKCKNCMFKETWLYENEIVMFCFARGKTIAPHICKICEVKGAETKPKSIDKN